MIVYLDTSALIKLLVDEPGTDAMLAVAAAAPVAASSALTEVEARAALARMRAGKRLAAAAHRAAVRRFEELWEEVGALSVDRAVLTRACALAQAHALRAYDAVHLASAREVAGTGVVTFACFDTDLRAAAAAEGLTLSPVAL